MPTTDKIEAPVYTEIIKMFSDNQPIKEISKELNISEVKVRRVLITEGLWSSPTSDEIYELYDKGLNAAQIAEKLMKPVKTVQQYMPYTRGEYSDGEISAKAQQSKDFRKRNRNAMERQVSADTKESKPTEIDNKIKEKDMEFVDFGEWKENAGYVGEGKKVYKLHLELQTCLDDEEEATLRKYGKAEKGISRDILVSGEMMLHNLHYAIQRAFGWQNSHLHNFAYPEKIFRELTDDKFPQWINLCGLYYRFPDEENEDLYWDDDYDESVSPRTWLKRKYSGNYNYDGISEHYMYAQTQAQAFKQQNPVLRIGPSFEEYMAGNKDSKVKNLEDVTMDEIGSYFESTMDELLERLPIKQVIAMNEAEKWKEKVSEIATRASEAFNENYVKLKKAAVRMSEKEIDEIYKKTDPEVIPLFDTLIYSYDYGDGWKVEITCTEIYESFDSWNKPSTTGWVVPPVTDEQIFNDQHPIDSKGCLIEGRLRDQIATVIVKRKPVCIAADGLPVMDDVGGPSGYCAFLNGIHGEDCGPYDYDNKEESLEWGRNMGWNGRMNKPENIL